MLECNYYPCDRLAELVLVTDTSRWKGQREERPLCREHYHAVLAQYSALIFGVSKDVPPDKPLREEPSVFRSKGYHYRGSVSPRKRYRVMRRDGFACVLCGATAEDDQLEVDHIIPSSQGGTDDESNLRTTCRTCNSGKSGDAS